MKRIFILFVSVCIFSTGLIGCSSNNDENSHVHSFSNDWSYDDTYHWHASTCGHDVIQDKENHVFGDWIVDYEATEYKEGKRHRHCTICDYLQTEFPDPTNINMDNFSFVLDDDGSGYEVAAMSKNIEGEIVIPYSYKGKIVKYIAKSGFAECNQITKVVLPSSLVLIKQGSFAGCSSLASITIPDSVVNIGDSAFYFCKSLTSITIPDSVLELGDSAFGMCSSLFSATIGKGITDIKRNTFINCELLENMVIPDNVTFIGESAFEFCHSLKFVRLSNQLKTIQSDAFRCCSSLIKIDIPDSVTFIGNYAFEVCTQLRQVIIGKSLRKVGYSVFGLTNVIEVINKSSVSNGDLGISSICLHFASEESESKMIFDEDGLIRYVNESERILVYFPIDNENVSIPNDVTKTYYTFIENNNVVSCDIPNNVVSIGQCTFSDCSNLLTITIPSSVISIENSAFKSCSSLTSIIIPNAVTQIEDSTFYNCSSLTSITIPESVNVIGSHSFGLCTSLKSITFNGTIEKWETMPKGAQWKVNVPDTCIVHCTDGDVTI